MFVAQTNGRMNVGFMFIQPNRPRTSFHVCSHENAQKPLRASSYFCHRQHFTPDGMRTVAIDVDYKHAPVTKNAPGLQTCFPCCNMLPVLQISLLAVDATGKKPTVYDQDFTSNKTRRIRCEKYRGARELLDAAEALHRSAQQEFAAAF